MPLQVDTRDSDHTIQQSVAEKIPLSSQSFQKTPFG